MACNTEAEKPYLIWDTCDITKGQAEFLMEQAQAEGEELSEEEAWQQAAEDTCLYQMEHESMCEELTTLMQELQKGGDGAEWFVGVKNFGWRSETGFMAFYVETGIELLRKVLPNTDCTFHIYRWLDGNGKMIGLKINNAHHDSPTWNEWYYIIPGQRRHDYLADWWPDWFPAEKSSEES